MAIPTIQTSIVSTLAPSAHHQSVMLRERHIDRAYLSSHLVREQSDEGIQITLSMYSHFFQAYGQLEQQHLHCSHNMLGTNACCIELLCGSRRTWHMPDRELYDGRHRATRKLAFGT
jgi:hypothetical protein